MQLKELIAQIREELSRGLDPIDVALRLHMHIDDVITIIRDYLS